MNTHLEILKKSYDRKRKENKKFSLRWLASNLEISPAMMSNILSGKRRIPPYLVEKITKVLDVTVADRDFMLQSILAESGFVAGGANKVARAKMFANTSEISANFVQASSGNLQVLKEWYYIAILEITKTKSYDGTTEQIAQRLGVDKRKIEIAFAELIDAGMLIYQNKKWIKNQRFLELTTSRGGPAIRALHIQQLEKAKETLLQRTSDEDRAKRFISGMTMTISENQVAKVRLRLRELVEEVSKEVASSSPDQIYHLALQFYPLENRESPAQKLS